MENPTLFNPNRRQFITKIVPACALTCFGGKNALALISNSNEQVGTHKFDTEYDKKLTYRQFYAMMYQGTIQLAKALEKEMGKDKMIEFLKKYTAEKKLKYGQDHAKRSSDNSFKTYTDTFRDPERYKNTLNIEIVEDTEKAFELKITECLWASTFIDANAGDIGYATICYGDYAWATGFNPKIKLIRDKTLMQGQDYCNHRYVLEG